MGLSQHGARVRTQRSGAFARGRGQGRPFCPHFRKVRHRNGPTNRRRTSRRRQLPLSRIAVRVPDALAERTPGFAFRVQLRKSLSSSVILPPAGGFRSFTTFTTHPAHCFSPLASRAGSAPVNCAYFPKHLPIRPKDVQIANVRADNGFQFSGFD